MIFEEDIENSDYIEIILTRRDIELILEKGLVKDFNKGLFGVRDLNVYIWLDATEEDDFPAKKKNATKGRTNVA